MAISIDSVYQQVLAIANKEQRGYITPQEFNLFARKAQLDIFENTFHDYKMALLKPASAIKIADDVDMLREKISLFRVVGASITGSTGIISFGDKPIHWLETVYDLDDNKVYEEVDTQSYIYIDSSPNSKISAYTNRPIFYRKKIDTVVIKPSTNSSDLVCDYITKPVDPNWGYVVVQEKALYNSNTSVNFELHDSEEGSLVNKILELAGISMKKPTLAELALRNEQLNETDKNN
tara:strand:- start:738 stop:1442 length:705 start_codon:yes stop_codon:yes gene_type:complete